MSWSTQLPPIGVPDALCGVSLENNGVTITAVKGNLVNQRVSYFDVL